MTRSVVVFTGAGMSAESGVPTYRGRGGIWHAYRWEEHACQAAFDREPRKVQDFHAERRRAVHACAPHAGHDALAAHGRRGGLTVITQNTDGLHQRAGSEGVLELHGSLWRVRCERHGEWTDADPIFSQRRCPDCGARLRPAVTWFGDPLDAATFRRAAEAIAACELFIAVGTSGVVWPAAGLQQAALKAACHCIEVNPEATDFSALFDEVVRAPASRALPALLARAARG